MGRMHDLDSLVKKFNWKTGVELGVASGATLFHLLENNPDLHMTGIDAYDVSFGSGDKYSTGFRKYEIDHQARVRQAVEARISKYKNGTLMVLPTILAAESFQDASLDFVFIDADHRESFVRADIAAWASKIKDDGYITGHDYKFSSVKKAIDDLLPGWKTAGGIWYIAKKDTVFKRAI